MFYRFKASRASIREFWWESKLLFWVGFIVKMFRLNLAGSTDDQAVDSLQPFQVEASTFPGAVEQFTPELESLHQLGFGEPIWHEINNPYQVTQITLATASHNSGKAIARVLRRVHHAINPPKIKFFTTFISFLRDGRFIVTTNGKADMTWPATHLVSRYRDLLAPELWKKHLASLGNHIPVPISHRSALIDAAEKYHVSLFDFHRQRGVFVPLTESERLLYEQTTPLSDSSVPLPPPAPASSDLMENATLAELDRIQNKKASWTSLILTLVVSLVFFILAAPRNEDRGTRDWTFMLMIVPILLFHELGHYIAMRIFGYRNLRMFFIPFFGAAVSGQHYNVPGWKKVIVSLMGPLPGIFLGVLLAAVGLILRKDTVTTVGLITIFLNAFNLLPILPLDGGWVAHAILFSRHYLLDTGFRLIAAILLITSPLFLPQEKFLMYVGIAMLVSLPGSWKTALVVRQLREEAIPVGSPDGQTIPRETAILILRKLKSKFRGAFPPKIAAQRILLTFESLNARPPGLLASFGFLTLHVASLLIGLVCIVGIIGVNQLRNQQFPEPAYSLDPPTLLTAGSAPASDDYVTLTLRFDSDAQAKSAFATASNFGSDPIRLTQFGRSLLISVPADDQPLRKKWFDAWEHNSADIFVERNDFSAALKLSFVAPNESAAAEIETELTGYFSNPSTIHLIPPWASPQDWPADQRAIHSRARRAFQSLQEGEFDEDLDLDTKEIQDVNKDILAALKRGDAEEAARLEKRQKELADARHLLHVDSIRAKFPDEPVIDVWEKITSDTDFRQRRQRINTEVAPLLGVWPPEKSTRSLVRHAGYVLRNAATLNLNINGFEHTDAGLSALLDWLKAKGCTKFKYDLEGSRVYDPSRMIEGDPAITPATLPAP